MHIQKLLDDLDWKELSDHPFTSGKVDVQIRRLTGINMKGDGRVVLNTDYNIQVPNSRLLTCVSFFYALSPVGFILDGERYVRARPDGLNSLRIMNLPLEGRPYTNVLERAILEFGGFHEAT